MKKIILIILFVTPLIILAQKVEPPLKFPDLEPNEIESENWSINTEIPYSVRALHYKKRLYTAIRELDKTITEDSVISPELVTMIMGVVASRNKCLY